MGRFGRGRRRLARGTGLVAIAGTLALAQTLPAAALDVTRSDERRVLGDLRSERVTIRLDDGSVARGDLLRFPESAPHLSLEPRLSNGTSHDYESVPTMARREFPRGGIAAINASYKIDRPQGNLNGLFVSGRRVSSTNASVDGGGQRIRSAVGISQAGQLLLDRVTVDQQLILPDRTTVPIGFMNRSVHLPRDVVLYDRTYARSFPLPEGAVRIVLDEQAVRSGNRTSHTVRTVEVAAAPTSRAVEAGTLALVVNHREVSHPLNTSPSLADLQPGDPVSIQTSVLPQSSPAGDWSGLGGAVNGVGLLLRDGRAPTIAAWETEGISDSSSSGFHWSARHPRTAVGRTPQGEVLLLTIDGRRAGWSTGVSAPELVEVFRALGAADAVNLDGGGSTTMTVAGAVRNRPSEAGRGVPDALFVYAPLPPPSRDLRQHACQAGDVPASGFGDTAGNTHATAIDCLIWWEVAVGRSPDRYDPRAAVRRQEMATMLAKLITVAADSGTGRPLPATASHPFTDVTDRNVHAGNIARLVAAGVVRGTSGTTFAPGANVTRDQVASMVAAAYEYSAGTSLPAGRDTFMDDNGNTHERAIDRLAAVGVIGGTGGYSYSPRNTVRRDAMSSFVMRAADLLTEGGVAQPPS
jgi:hypothetical protein